MKNLLKPAVAAVVLCCISQAWAIDAHQMVVPQSDGVAIEPQHRAHVLADPNRVFQLNEDPMWLVMEPSTRRALMPDEESDLDAEEARIRAEAEAARHNRVKLFFAFDKSQPLSWSPLSAILEKAREPGTHVKVVGHADEVGTRKYNQRLSEKRAIAVSRYLAHHGVDKHRIHAEGHGKREPVAHGAGAKNRRVVVDVILEEEDL